MKWTMHNINAWENETHVSIDTLLESNGIMAEFAQMSCVKAPNGCWTGRYARVTMPNPKARDALDTGAATVQYLTPEDLYQVEFGVVNPAKMWTEETRYIFGTAWPGSGDSGPLQYIIRVDTETGEIKKWSANDYSAEDLAKFADPEVYLGNEGFHQVGAPEFIPKDANQPADSAAGVILSYWLSPDNEPQLYIVDGVTMEAVAVLNLPIPKMPSVGLHNHFSKYPPSV